MTTLLFKNNAASTLAGAINTSVTSLNLAAGGGAAFPNPSGGQAFTLTIVDAATGLLREIMSCTARSTDTLTVVRAQEGTTALSWNPGDLVQQLWTAGQAAQMLQIGQAPSSIVYFGVDVGSVNALQATVTPALASLVDGQLFEIRALHTNTSRSATLNLTGTPYPIARGDGSQLQINDIVGPVSAQLYSWNAANSEFLLMTPAIWNSVFTLANGLNFYVNFATGNDANSGLTVSVPFKTLQGAVNAIAAAYSATTFVQINVADSASYAGFNIPASLISLWKFVGNSGTPQNCLVSASSTGVNNGYALSIQNANVNMLGFEFTAYNACTTVFQGTLTLTNCKYIGIASGSCLGAWAQTGGFITMLGNFTVTGTYVAFWNAGNGGSIQMGQSFLGGVAAVSFTFSSTVTTANAVASSTSTISFANAATTLSGTVTGQRYLALAYSVIDTQGGGANYIPGTIAGSVTNSTYQ